MPVPGDDHDAGHAAGSGVRGRWRRRRDGWRRPVGGGQTIYVSKGAKQFVRVTLVKLPKASATASVSDYEVVKSMIWHNGLPTDSGEDAQLSMALSMRVSSRPT